LIYFYLLYRFYLFFTILSIFLISLDLRVIFRFHSLDLRKLFVLLYIMAIKILRKEYFNIYEIASLRNFVKKFQFLKSQDILEDIEISFVNDYE
jgi:hypothetical protein